MDLDGISRHGVAPKEHSARAPTEVSGRMLVSGVFTSARTFCSILFLMWRYAPGCSRLQHRGIGVMTRESAGHRRDFPPTRWTLVREAATISTEAGFRALEPLLQDAAGRGGRRPARGNRRDSLFCFPCSRARAVRREDQPSPRRRTERRDRVGLVTPLA